MNKPDAARACRLRLPITSPFPQYQLFQSVNTNAERIRLGVLVLLGDGDVSSVQIPSVDLVRVAATRGEQQRDIAYRTGIRPAARNSGDLVLGGTDRHG